MANRFVSFLKAVGHDIKVILPWVATTGETAVQLFFPGMSALFNATVGAVSTAEQAFPLQGSGLQKAAAVTQLMGPLIKQSLVDAGKPADDAAVQKYLDAVVLILDTTPGTTAQAAAAAITAPPLPK